MGSIERSNVSIRDQIQDITRLSEGFKGDDGRQALLRGARQLVASLETPAEKVTRMSWYEPTLQAAVRLGVDLKLFEKMLADNGKPKTATQLASETNCEVLLLERLMKHLASGFIIEETDVDTYAPNTMTETLADPLPQGMIINCHEGMAMTKQRLVPYFRSRGYKMPTDKADTVFRYSAGLEKDWIQWMLAPGNEEHANAFNNHMKFRTLSKKWYQLTPVAELLGPASNFETDDNVLMVDIGGSTGHDLFGFHNTYPQYKGRLISQDLDTMIKTIDPKTVLPVELQYYDFFKPQPIKGAKCYYLRRVLHGWPDEECVQILSHIKDAMTRGYSKLLVNEIVIPETEAPWYSTSIDMFMLLLHSAKERRTRDWQPLFAKAGLKLVKIWECGEEPEKLMEVELA